MSKAKKSAPKTAAPTKTPQASAPVVAPRRQWWLIGGIVAVAIVVLAGVGYMVFQPFAASVAAPAAPSKYGLGSVTYCTNVQAPFAATQGFSRRAVLDTRSQAVKGLRIFEPDQNGNPTRSYQHPTWTQAGFLGPPVIDKDGAVYVIPIPAINLLDNPPDKANTIWRVDPKTGEMRPLITLPATAPPTPENPYGLLGLTYDCDTHSLYASSTLGSTRAKEQGRLYRIDIAAAKVTAQIDGADGFGLAVYNGAHGKRLYYGLARTPDVRSVSLDDSGNFRGAPRPEFSLADQGYHGDERVRQITVMADDTLTLRLTQFDFNLIAPTEIRQTGFTYTYDNATDTWQQTKVFPITT